VSQRSMHRYDAILETARPMLGVMSDNAVCDALVAHGYQVEPCTVSSWRRQLGIPALRKPKHAVTNEWTPTQRKAYERAARDYEAGVTQQALAERLGIGEARMASILAQLRGAR